MSRHGRGAVCQTKLVEIVVVDIFPYSKLASCQPVAGEVQNIQVSEVAQFRWNCPAQIVIAEVEGRQRGKVAQFRRNRPAQLVAVESEFRQCGEVTYFRWNCPAQIVEPEDEFNNPVALIRSDTIPGADRRVGKPVVVVRPVIAASSMVERHQNVPVRGSRRGDRC